MKHMYKLALILLVSAGFAFAQTGAGSQSTPPTLPSEQPQPGAQTPDNSQMGQSGTSSAGALSKAQSDIQSALRNQMPAIADNVNVSTTGDNKIQLSGTVSTDSEKSQVEQLARSTTPNVDIVNNLKVSSSPSMPPTSSEPPDTSKPPVLRLVAYQQSGSQDTQSPQNPNYPTSSAPNGVKGGADQTSTPNNVNSGDVQNNIQKAIQQEPSLASSNINVNVANKKVELTGTVASKDQMKTAQKIAQSNAGGMKVVDHLKVSSAGATPSTPSTPPKY